MLGEDGVVRMNLSRRYAALLLAPPAALALIVAQGLHARRVVLRLPEAQDPDGLHGESDEEPWHLVVIGDSVAAGVGIAHHGLTLAGRLAMMLAEDRAVRRTVIAQSGLTAAGVLDLVRDRPELATADAVIVSVGVNDTKNLHSLARWRRDLTALLDAVTQEAPEAPVVLLGLPSLEKFVSLPRALRYSLGLRARQMDRIGRSVAAGYPAVRRMEMHVIDVGSFEEPWASDGFHPSESVHAVFASRIHALI
jgi:lysophospholipase L1-like esterase